MHISQVSKQACKWAKGDREGGWQEASAWVPYRKVRYTMHKWRNAKGRTSNLVGHWNLGYDPRCNSSIHFEGHM